MNKFIRTSTSGDSRTVYHTDKSCRLLRVEPQEATDRDIEILDLRECKLCAGEADQSKGSGNREYYQALVEAADD